MYRGWDLGLLPEGPGTRNAVHIVAVPCPNSPIKDLHPPLVTKLAAYSNSEEMIQCPVSYNDWEVSRYWCRGGVGWSRYLRPPPPVPTNIGTAWGPPPLLTI
jgi:hypothetical protein